MSDIITHARALLAAATPGPWEALDHGAAPIVEAVNKVRGMRAAGDPYPTVARMPKSYSADIGNAALIAAAPELIAALCDEVEASAKRNMSQVGLIDAWAGKCERVEAERDALRAEVERLRARKARLCDLCLGWGLARLDGSKEPCPACGGSGAAIVEGEK